MVHGNLFRHDFRTHLNHIAGYSEILMLDSQERGELAIRDLFGNIHTISLLIRDASETFFKSCETVDDKIDTNFTTMLFSKLYEIIGLLQTIKSKPSLSESLTHDIESMLGSANTLFDLFSNQHDSICEDKEVKKESQSLNLEYFHDVKSSFAGRILAVDDDPVNRELIIRYLERQGHTVCFATNGQEALEMLQKVPFDLVILDVMMPGMNGYQVLEVIKKSRYLHDMPVIVISALDEARSMAKCIELGAEDYLPREFDPYILKARIDASLEKHKMRIQQNIAIQAILDAQERLRMELADAAEYVRSLLPEPIFLPNIKVNWEFIPSLSLGGDIFGYHFLEEDKIAMYLIDVSGHGIEAALVSVTLMNMLKAGTLIGANFSKPESVLTALNKIFKIEEQNNMYFTIWYGVVDLKNQNITYSSAGSSPAILINPNNEKIPLTSEDVIIGLDETIEYHANCTKYEKGSKLFIFSDGLYEIRRESGQLFGIPDLLSVFSDSIKKELSAKGTNERIITTVKNFSSKDQFEDDVSLLTLFLE